MKNLMLIAMAFIMLQANAQDHKKDHPKKDKKEHMQRHMDFTPEQMATLRTKKMTLSLDLTAAQQKSIHKIILANAKARKAKMEAHKKMKAANKGEKPSKEARFKMMNTKLDQQIAIKKQMKAVLSKEQFEKFEKDAKQKHMKQRKHMKQGKQMKQRAKKQRSKRS